MSYPNNYIITQFVRSSLFDAKTRNLTYDARTRTLRSYGTIIAFHLNGAVYVNGATKKLSGTSISKTTAGHINQVIDQVHQQGLTTEVYAPARFDLMYASVVKVNGVTKSYMEQRRKEVEF